jgi:hypothetical protein
MSHSPIKINPLRHPPEKTEPPREPLSPRPARILRFGVLTQTKKRPSTQPPAVLSAPSRNNNRHKHTLRRRRRLATPESREELSRQIRHYSHDDLVRDYTRLVEIGCKAKHQSTKMLTGNRVVDAFTFTERLNTIGTKGISFYDLWENRESYSRKPYIKKYLAFAKKQHQQKTAKVWYNLYRFYFTSINCFRPLVAMEYYCKFSPKCVLDMTAGWGGRLVGACALNIPKYIGIDNNEALRDPYRKLVEFLKPQTKTDMEIRIEDALKVDYSKYTYDMVFTSPPYYDLEIYGSAPAKYGTKDKWDAEFYKPLFESTYRHMQSGGHYCLNVSPEIYERACIPTLGECTDKYPLKKSDRQTESRKKYTEFVYVWRKP